jgi:membrane protein
MMTTQPAEAVEMVDPRPPVPAPKGPLARLVERVLKFGPVRWLIPILAAYDAAGGGLLASGLAFNSLFAILPAILLIIAVVGVLLGDPSRLLAVSDSLSASFPPLAGFFTVALGGFAHGAVTYSVVGVVALVWGASRFYQSLDDAMARIFESTRRRDPLRRSMLGVVSVLLLATMIGAGIVVSNVATGLAGNGLPGSAVGSAILSTMIGAGVASVVAFSAGVAIIYRLLPTNQPGWRMIARPAVAVGTFAALFTALFSVLTPQLVGSLQVYGAFVAVFAAMIWLSLISQALMLGAAWVHRRVVVDGASKVADADDGTHSWPPPSTRTSPRSHDLGRD